MKQTKLACILFTCLFFFNARGERLLPAGPLSGLRLSTPPGLAEQTQVPAEHPAFSEAMQVRVTGLPAQVHQIQLNQRNSVAVAEGDMIRVRMILRSANPGGAPAVALFFVQDVAKRYQAVFNREVSAGAGWNSQVFTFKVPENMEPGRMQFAVFLGSRVQALEIGRFDAERVDASDLGPVADLRRPVSVQGEYLEVNSSKESITGALPVGWEEDSAWADVAVNYRPQFNNPHAGDRALRIDVGRVSNGVAQFRVPNVAVMPSHMIRMRIPLRSEDSRSVTLTLRKRTPPYTAYWETSLGASPEWGVFERIAIVQEHDPDASLIFSMNTPGTLEVGDFELEYLTPEQVLSGVNFEGNLLTTSSFPLGLSAPWAVGANGTTPEHLSADPSQPGPSGLPALRMMPHRFDGRYMMQVTSPFQGKPGEAHTISFWAKADRPGMNVSMRMGPPSAQLWRDAWHKSISLSTEWTRYEHTVVLPPAPDMLYLARITSHDAGTSWMDQVMVEVGERAGEFRKTGTVELHAVAERD